MFQSTVSSGPSQSTSPPSSMAVTSSAPTSGSPPAAQRCCDTGRTLFTDPISGQSVCSCQYEMLGYQRLAGVPGLPPLSMYSAPYPEGMAAYFPALGADQAPFYTSAVSTYSTFGLPNNTFKPLLNNKKKNSKFMWTNKSNVEMYILWLG